MTITGIEIPVSVTGGTGSYTVPANMYAIVTACCDSAGGGTALFSINGTLVLSTHSYNTEQTAGVFASIAGGSVTGVYKVPTGTVINSTGTSGQSFWSVSLFNS